MLFPATPQEAFDFSVQAFDLADRLQTPVIVMSDLDLGMNEWLTPELAWDDARRPDRGKVMSAEALERGEKFFRYLDVDGDGVGWRTLPGTHPSKGAYFTRGSGHDKFGRYTEDGALYQENVDRLLAKFQKSVAMLPEPEIDLANKKKSSRIGVIAMGTTWASLVEARHMLAEQGVEADLLRVRSFPFHSSIREFVESRDKVFVLEQNRDAQLRGMLTMELEIDPKRLVPLLSYDGMPVTASFLQNTVLTKISDKSRRGVPS